MECKLTRREKRALLVGMVIGDGHLRKNGASISITHNEKQIKYLQLKALMLETILDCKTINIRKVKPNKYNTNCYVIEKGHKYFRILRNWIYKDNKKCLSRKILNMLDLPAIAIWYMDDGCLSAKKRNGKIHAYELILNTYLTAEENQIIIDYFKEVWDIQFGLNKSKGLYRLRMGTKEARRFCKLIKPYTSTTMEYKLLVD